MTTAKSIASKAESEFDDLKEHLSAIREDISALALTTRNLAVGQAKKQVHRVGDIAGNAADKAAKYRDAAAETVKDHPFAAIGIAALAGLIFASLSRR